MEQLGVDIGCVLRYTYSEHLLIKAVFTDCGWCLTIDFRYFTAILVYI